MNSNQTDQVISGLPTHTDKKKILYEIETKRYSSSNKPKNYVRQKPAINEEEAYHWYKL